MTEKLITAARRIVPKSWRYAVQRYIPLTELKLWYRRRTNSVASVVSRTGTRSGDAYRFAIAANPAQYHQHYVKACLEMTHRGFSLERTLVALWWYLLQPATFGLSDSLIQGATPTLPFLGRIISEKMPGGVLTTTPL